jgi:phage regulator Rha-like protein
VTLKTGRGQHLKYLPYAFTEHGALMAANVLNSARAVKMSVYVVRAFIKQREMLMAQADILKRLAQMDKKLLQHDEVLKVIWTELQPLLQPPPAPPKPRIGF